MTDVVLPTRLMGMMRREEAVSSNAAGGVNPNFKPGIYDDHRSYYHRNSKSADRMNIEELGNRFRIVVLF